MQKFTGSRGYYGKNVLKVIDYMCSIDQHRGELSPHQYRLHVNKTLGIDAKNDIPEIWAKNVLDLANIEK